MKYNPNNPATYGHLMIPSDKVKSMMQLIIKKLNKSSEATITRKRDGEEFFIKCYSGNPTAGDDTWFLYEGCDLVIGDVTLNYLAGMLLNELA